MRRHIPNTITCLNLISGFAAILFAIKGEVTIASWAIAAAMIFDFFDGLSARALKAYSDIGKELDSLADLVSFGVAPAIIIISYLQNSCNCTLLNMATVIMPVCAACRLAKFNVDETQKDSFKGLPVPASAIMIITVVIADKFGNSDVAQSILESPALTLILTTILSILMVTRIPLISLKFHNLHFQENSIRFLMLIAMAIGVIIWRWRGLMLIIPIYLIASIIDNIWKVKFEDKRA